MEPSAIVFDIEKFAVHDGPGIRTNVFLKGCPLRCLWCHNPESQSFEPELMFSPEKCTLCGACAKNCPRNCHTFEGEKHLFDRKSCIACGKCTEECYSGALEKAGKRMTVSEVLSEVLKDEPFYRNSGGGMTLSGGEPLAHSEFTRALLEAAKKAGIHTAVETCGFSSWEMIEPLLPLTDLWLWDQKALPEDHKCLTGVESDRILENLRKVDAAGGNIVLRCPLVPGVNDSEKALGFIAELAESLVHCHEINVEPYHPLGETKSEHLGREQIFRAPFAEKETIARWKTFLEQRTTKIVKQG